MGTKEHKLILLQRGANLLLKAPETLLPVLGTSCNLLARCHGDAQTGTPAHYVPPALTAWGHGERN